MKRFLFVSLALVGMVATAPSAHAALLGPGEGSLVADAFVAETGTLYATSSGLLNNLGIGGTIDASFQEWVYKETGTGFLNFIYQVTVNTGSDALEQIAVSNFAGFGSAASSTKVDVGVTATPLAGPPIALAGGVAPNAGLLGNVVSRSGSGATVNFQFTGATEVTPGTHTVLLTVQTNSTVTTGGRISVQDSTSTFTADLGPGIPVAAVPEPSTMAIAGLGALGLIGFGLRRRKAMGA